MASKDALNAAYEDVRSDSSDTVWYVTQIKDCWISSFVSGLHSQAVKKVSSQIAMVPIYKNCSNSLQVCSQAT